VPLLFQLWLLAARPTSTPTICSTTPVQDFNPRLQSKTSIQDFNPRL
jgi:hypothetical protein